MDIRIVTYPGVAAVLPAEMVRLKTFLRIETADEDMDIAEMYVAATQTFSKLTGRDVTTTARRYAVPMLCDSPVIELPYPELLAVSAVKWFDSDDTETTLNSTLYIVETVGNIGRVVLKPEGVNAISDISTLVAHPVVIYYTSGYGADTSSVPLGIRMWCRECVKWMYSVKDRMAIDGIPDYLLNLAAHWKLGKEY